MFSDALGTPGGLDAFERSGFGALQIIVGSAPRMDLLYPPRPRPSPPLHHSVGGGGGGQGGTAGGGRGARGRRLGEQTFSRSPGELEPAGGEEGDAWRK